MTLLARTVPSLVALAFLTLCAVPALPQATGRPALDKAVPSEHGFEGAVTVIECAANDEDPDLEYVTVEIPYRDIDGAPKHGQGRLILRRRQLDAGAPLPVFCHVHYEKSVGGAKEWCDRGWAVVTPHYSTPEQGGYPLELCTANSNNHSRALLQWACRLPFIDRAHMHIDGGSAGGYMALAMSADFFPVAATTADAPVCNWSYNLNYLEANKPASKYPLPDFTGMQDLKRTPLPILYSITGLVDQSKAVFGEDLAADAYYLLSPTAYLDRITCPVMILCATGDMLVPHEQMTSNADRPYDGTLFPANYARDFDRLTLCEKARHRVDELVAPDRLAMHLVPTTEGMHEYSLGNFIKEEKEPKGPPELDRPWTPDKQWNLVVLDEGPPKPYSTHTRYKWSTSPRSFAEALQKRDPAPEILNAAKLDRLLQRYEGRLEGEAVLVKTGQPANRLNFQPLEQLDVVSGLIAYAELGPEHAERLTQLYAASARKPLGETARLERIISIRSELRASLGMNRQNSWGTGQ